MLHGKTQPPRARGPEHQPVGAPREIFVRKRLAEHFIVDAEVLDGNAAFRHSGRSPCLEDIERFAGKPLRHPPAHRPAPQPFVLERREFSQIFEAADLASRVPTQLRRPLQPERTSCLRIEVPLDHLTHMGIELCLCFLHSKRQVQSCRNTHEVIPPRVTVRRRSGYPLGFNSSNGGNYSEPPAAESFGRGAVSVARAATHAVNWNDEAGNNAERFLDFCRPRNPSKTNFKPQIVPFSYLAGNRFTRSCVRPLRT